MQRISVLRYQGVAVLFILFALTGAALFPAGAARAGNGLPSDPPPDQVAVKLKPSASISTILARYSATLVGSIPEDKVYMLRLPAGQTAAQKLPAMRADADLYYAEPNYYGEGAPTDSMIIFGGTGGLTPTPVGGWDQWAWSKTGLTAAQKISNGQGVVVAVLDTGLATDHPLLQSSLAQGYDFIGMDNAVYDQGNGLDDNGNGLIDEAVGHGTHISGIILTVAPGVQVMPIRVLNSDGMGTYWEVAQGIRYAVDQRHATNPLNVRVINMSMSAPRMTPELSDALAYAAANGVLVVAAAGIGPGPNYPAGYSDKLAVLGVGASDKNDAIAAFSGGLPTDTDIFAPGVDIYSAYPYNGYALGSGTSMAAPIISAEAALLFSRHPDWSVAEVTQRILGHTVPVAGSAAGRVDLAGALQNGIEVDHASPDLSASPTDQYILPRVHLFNDTAQDIPLSQLTMRYWYTFDSAVPQTFHCDYAFSVSAPVACSYSNTNVTGTFVALPANSPNKTGLSDGYLETGFTSGAGTLPSGGQVDMYWRVFKTDISNINELNDYSYDDPTKPDRTRWNRITVYLNGVLVWGVEPNLGNVTPPPTATRTPAPATVTATRTNTPAGPSITPTRTSTAVPPTATRTNTAVAVTATRTSTPIAPSATPTSVPATATKTATPASGTTCVVTYTNASDWGSAFSGSVTITNTGATAINGWTLTWTFPGNQVITGLWGGTYTQTGMSVVVKDAGYNATLAANGGNTNFGFNANYSGANAKPASFSLNGTVCQ